MRIKTVTITGADDKVKPIELMNISQRFPFVEWGILFSPTRNKEGAPRYPSWNWVDILLQKLANMDMNFSAHLCGGYTEEFLTTGYLTQAFKDIPDVMFLNIFKRYQLNFDASKHDVCDEFFNHFARTQNQTIIQYNKNNHELWKRIISECDPNRNIHMLYDASAGSGELPTDSYPSPWPLHFTGYAGGLSPDSLEEELNKMNKNPFIKSGITPIWIDTESGVRTNNEFDLDKVVKFLEIAGKYTY